MWYEEEQGEVVWSTTREDWRPFVVTTERKGTSGESVFDKKTLVRFIIHSFLLGVFVPKRSVVVHMCTVPTMIESCENFVHELGLQCACK